MPVSRLALAAPSEDSGRLSDEVQLYQRTYTTLLRSSGETQLRVLESSHRATGSSLHPLAATEYAGWQQAWRATLDTNLLGPANLCHLAGNAMLAAGGGRVVSISSRGAFRGEPEAPAYAASKAGLNALSQSLARALAAQGVYFYVVAPGWVATDMANSHLEGPEGAEILAQHPLGRVASPEEVAAAAVFCALDAPPAMTGSILDVNGASYLRT